jgi:hypothetical protein
MDIILTFTRQGEPVEPQNFIEIGARDDQTGS